jgi:signal transduction histidine kinase
MQSGPVDILLVDDHGDNLVALEAILRDLHQNVVKVESGKEALRQLLMRDFAVILLDVNMPIMDGFETAALIRGRTRSENTPIIFITAHGDETHVVRGYSLGAVDYILTPVVPEVLRAKVSVFVELFRKTAEVRRRAAQLHLLTQASLAINAAPSAEHILQLVADRGRQIVGARQAEVELRLGDGRIHRAVSAAGGVVEALGSHRTTPLVSREGARIGQLRLAGRDDGAFCQADEDLLVQLGQMASIAIQNTVYSEEREANRLKDEFLATVSHELRTPLTAMLTWATLLRDHRCDATMAARGVEVIERSAKAQAKLIDDLLDMSRIMTGKMRLSLRPLDLQAVVRGALESVSPAASAKSISLAAEMEPGTVDVAGDSDRLQQVMWNLLTNAIKFTPRGGRIEVRVRRGDTDVEVAVADTGAGIAPEFLPRVFDRFRQAESANTRMHGGLGLGLAIVRHLIDLHGGTVRAESEGRERGATFVVTLPHAREAAAMAASPGAPSAPTFVPVHPGAAPPRSTDELDLGGLRILVVEDDPDGCEAISLVLSGAGADVRTAPSARVALEITSRWVPDVLVSDIGLPDEDGHTLLRKIRALGNDLPAVALTAYTRSQDRTRALAAGFAAHLGKPIEPHDLVAVVARFRDRGGTAPLLTGKSSSVGVS